LGVEIEADGFDVAALLAAKQIAGTTKFQVERGNFESCSQVGEFLQRGQATVRPRN
jgi:hypothetical protein